MIRRVLKAAFLAWIAKKAASYMQKSANRSAGQRRRHAREASR